MSHPVKNIAAYKFVDTEPQFVQNLRVPLRDRLRSIGARGTVVLSPEGINVFLSGTRDVVDDAWRILTSYSPYNDLEYSETFSREVAFNRMLVKVKDFIIPAGINPVNPAEKAGPRVDPQTLKRWLDSDDDVVLVDTRNEYEVKLGSFQNAIDLGLENFRSFGNAVERLDESLKDRRIVMFCTGGIRCEKASPIMMDRGFKEVYQLDGGILRYFEEVGGRHYNGECFVFDQRVAVNSDLEETSTVQCFRCQQPLTLQQQQEGPYLLGEYCPFCYGSAT